MYDGARLECAAEIRRRVSLCPTAGDGISEDLARRLNRLVRELDCIASLDLTNHRQQLGRRDLGDGSRAEHRKQLSLEQLHDPVSVSLAPSALLLLMPLPRDRLERVRAIQTALRLRAFLFVRWIETGAQLLLDLVTGLPGSEQRHGRIDPEGHPFLLAIDAILQPPVLRPVRHDFEVHALAIGQLIGLLARLRRANSDIGKGHLGMGAFRCPKISETAPYDAP
ncbi:hypothetical protein FEP52_04812 [Burkholderia multivorans]|nr:hypothetical protein [Burkholderia multivorans]